MGNNCGWISKKDSATSSGDVTPYRLIRADDKTSSTSGTSHSSGPLANAPRKASLPPNCDECQKAITASEVHLKEVIEVANKRYHIRCFTCFKCKKSINGKVVNSEGKRYCDSCAKQEQADKRAVCTRCGKKIQDAVVTELGGQYHKACWTCETCHTLLDQFVVVGNKPYCPDCGRKAGARASVAQQAVSGSPTTGGPLSSSPRALSVRSDSQNSFLIPPSTRGSFRPGSVSPNRASFGGTHRRTPSQDAREKEANTGQ